LTSGPKRIPARFYRTEAGVEPEGNRIARVLFCFAGNQMVLLLGFIKKARKTPKGELDLARKRMKEVAR